MTDSPPLPFPRARRSRPAFTLVELLVVIGIIALLVSILIPVAGRVRIAGQAADTQSLIRAIDAAVQVYHADHQAYPGPLADGRMGVGVDSGVDFGGTAGDGFYRGGSLENVTASENLVLGLLGGLVPGASAADPAFYNPAAVGRGPVRLNFRTPGGYSPYMDVKDASLSMHDVGDQDVDIAGASAGDGKWGRFVDDLAAADDSAVPEFVDRFSNPLPILYLRAIPVGRITETTIGDDDGKIIATDGTEPGVFDQRQIAGYVAPNGGASIGVGKSPALPYSPALSGSDPYYHGLQFPLTGNTGSSAELRGTMQKGEAGYTYPYDVRAYLTSPNAVGARQGDRYVLISAGKDRVYGTEDDLTNFGAVLP